MANPEKPYDRHMLAIGAIVAAWTHIEVTYHGFIMMLIPDKHVALRVYELLGNESRWALVRDELPAKLHSDAERDRLQHFLKAAAICKENRNAVAHAEYVASDKPDTLIAYRGRSKDLTRHRFHELPLEALHAIKSEIQDTAMYGVKLYLALAFRGEPDSPLPDKPPLPRKWDLRSPPIPQDDPPPPPPSPA
jgi:hypothetical protein